MIVIPVGITAKTKPEEKNLILDKVKEITEILNEAGIRAESDLR